MLTSVLLRGEANYARRAAALAGLDGGPPGHYLIVLKDAERRAYHSLVRVGPDGALEKVAGPDAMPTTLGQKLLGRLFKYNTAARQLEPTQMRGLSGTVIAATLDLPRRK